jgi:hypothetical protein
MARHKVATQPRRLARSLWNPVARLLRVADFAYFNMLCAASYLCPPSKPLQPILPFITPYHQLSHIDSVYTSTTITLVLCQPAAMWLLKLLVLLQVLVGVSAVATDFFCSSPSLPDAQVAKRWFTVPDKQQKKKKHMVSVWPPVGTMEGPRRIPYCFEDDAAFKIIGDILPAALDKWAPAMKVSSLAFAPDPACTGENESPCLCSTKGIKEVTVHLQLDDGATLSATWGY